MHTVLENMVILVIKFSNQLTYNFMFLLIHFMVYRFSYAQSTTYYHFNMFKAISFVRQFVYLFLLRG